MVYAHPRAVPKFSSDKLYYRNGLVCGNPIGPLRCTKCAPLRTGQLVLRSLPMACRPFSSCCCSLIVCACLIASQLNDAAALLQSPIALDTSSLGAADKEATRWPSPSRLSGHLPKKAKLL